MTTCEVRDIPRKILYVIDTLEVGGAEQSILEIYRRLDRGRFQPIVCHVYAGDTLQSHFEAAGVPVFALDVPDKYHFPTAIRRLCRVIDQQSPDLIHTTLFRADQIGRVAGRIKGVPVVSSLVNDSYDPIRLQDNPHMSRWKLRTLQWTDRGTSGCVRQFHAVSESIKTANCRHLRIRPDRVTVVPRGRDLKKFENGNARRESGGSVSDGRYTILSVGRLIDQKGHKYLLQALPHVRKCFPQAHLQIAGSGWLEPDLRQRAIDLGLDDCVQFLGRRDDIPELLAACDVFAFPSLYEGMPGALIEAMLSGCAIVASDIPMNRELIESDIHGLLVSRMDATALAQAIITMLRDGDKRREMGQLAAERARRRFDINLVVRQMEDLYDAAVSRE